ncbi:MAG: hypothetical protein CMP80_06985 [Formosa sp.]|nr:hypothetical protein [Formosa sp.]|tara:strand:- start:7348 stop:8292 length:945 start_codon:yes stop_codon:yes gene_type:complete
MITRFFRISKPFHYVLFFGALILVYFLQRGNYLYTAQHLNFLLELAIFSSFLVSIFLMIFIITKNNLTQNNSFAALYFSLFILLVPESIAEPKVIFSNMFVLLAFRRIFSVQTKINLKKKYFDAGLWLSLATVFYVWAILYFIPLLATIFLWKTDQVKHLFVIIFGALSVFVITLISNIILNTDLPDLVLELPTQEIDFYSSLTFQLKISMALIMVISICSFFTTLNQLVFKNIQTRSLFITLYLMFLTGVLIFLITYDKTPKNLLFLTFPLAVIAANFTQMKKTLWTATLFILTLIIFVAVRCYDHIKFILEI